MTISSNTSKLEALARARAWRDQRCATPPRSTSAKKVKRTTSDSHDQDSFTYESPRRVPAGFPTNAGACVATRTPKNEARDRALTRAREFATRLKEKKEHPKEGNDMNIPTAINIDDDTLSNSTPTLTVHETDMSAAKIEEMKRIAADMKKLSERLEAVTK